MTGYHQTHLPGHRLARKNGLVPTHRLVAEQKIGRPLRKGEVVHHRNGDRGDNRPENLRVFPSTSAHLAHHWRRRSVPLFGRHARYVAHVTGVPFAEVLNLKGSPYNHQPGRLSLESRGDRARKDTV